jgi:hypothetical protein
MKPVVIRQQILIAETKRTTGPTVFDIKESGGQIRTDISGLGWCLILLKFN